jgi:hypothetical protein
MPRGFSTVRIKPTSFGVFSPTSKPVGTSAFNPHLPAEPRRYGMEKDAKCVRGGWAMTAIDLKAKFVCDR